MPSTIVGSGVVGRDHPRGFLVDLRSSPARSVPRLNGPATAGTDDREPVRRPVVRAREVHRAREGYGCCPSPPSPSRCRSGWHASRCPAFGLRFTARVTVGIAREARQAASCGFVGTVAVGAREAERVSWCSAPPAQVRRWCALRRREWHGAAQPAHLEVGTSGRPRPSAVNGMKAVVAWPAPQRQALASGASAPPLKCRISSLNGCSGFSLNVVVSCPVARIRGRHAFEPDDHAVARGLRVDVERCTGGPVIGPLAGPPRYT